MKSVIGIDLGATNLRVCYGDDSQIKKKATQKVIIGEDSKALIDQLIQMVNSLKAKNFTAIGIGAVGPLDVKKGRILNTPNLPYNNFDLAKPLEKEFKVPVYIVNDCDAGVIAEKFYGHGKNEKDLAYVTISSGIGCGVLLNNKLILGKDGNATEMGHVVVSSEGNIQCGCGGFGHWEGYCSGRNIPNYAKFLLGTNLYKKSIISSLTKNSVDNLTSEIIFEAAGRKDTTALHILEKIGIMNAIGIATVNNAFDVSLISIGGSVAVNNKDFILNPIKKHMQHIAYNRSPRVEITNLGEDVVPLGALALASNYEKLVEL